MNEPEWPGEPEPAEIPQPEVGGLEPQALGPVAWEDPDRPRLAGYFQTLGEVLRRPVVFFSRPAWGGSAEPFAFALITGTAGSLLALFWWTLLLLSRCGLPATDLFRMGLAGSLAVATVLIPLVVLAKLALASLCLWGAASLLGARVGWAPIWRLCGYAVAAAALAVIPFLGSFLAVPMVLFILHQGLRGALGMSGGRALGTLAVFLILQLLATAFLAGGFLALLALLGLFFLS